MGNARSASQFFDDYAHDFDAIYGGRRGSVGRILDGIFRKSMRLRFERTLIGCRPVAGKTVLDVGCGPGHYGVSLASEGAARVVMLDPAKEMIRIAENRARIAGVRDRCEFVHTTFEDYRPDEEFDFCILMGLMDYIADPYACVRHAVEITRGAAFFSFPADGGLLGVYRRYRYRNRTPLYLYRRDQLRAILDGSAADCFSIEQLARDFFVRVDAARVHSESSRSVI
ncbi:MAG: class I SAM-dependent methyltransferase [Gammaproteobacteria bacterium]